MAVILSREIQIPSMGTPVSDLAEGSIVLIPENGVNVEFYVAKHDYESGLNGAGRTLLVRKDCYNEQSWHTSKDNTYESSAIDTWLNGSYYNLLGESVKNVIGQTTFYYTSGSNVSTLSRSVFMLSLEEVGKSTTVTNSEGTALPIASTLLIAYLNGSAISQWTRTKTKNTYSKYNAAMIYSSGIVSYTINVTSTAGIRPIFTIPSNALFDPDTGEFLGVA